MKYIVYILSVLVLLFGVISFVYYLPDNTFSKSIKKIFPITIKTFIRDTIFIISEKNLKIKNLEIFSLSLIKKRNQSLENHSINIFETNNDNYFEIVKYKLPFYNRDISNKTVAHIDHFENYIIIITGNGEIFFLKKNDLYEENLDIQKIKHNLHELITDLRFYDDSINFLNSDEISIKDIFIDEEIIYLSYVKEVKKDCFNTSVLSAKLNVNYLNFDTFFTYDECLSFKNVEEFNGQQSGGRIINYQNKILLTIGEYRKRELAQNLDSNFGKIVSIDKSTNQSNIFSSGHRNPQGLYYDSKLEIILSTEHGPKGGDELNIIKENNNYGWPISSYGEHYDGTYKKEAPLHKSHKDYGFTEPIYYFTPSIGISEVIRANGIFNPSKNFFFITSLKDKSIYIFEINTDDNLTKLIDKINIDERVRDIIYLKTENIYVALLENTPSIALIKYKN